jgi:dipeptidyl aminopeptidase/acylaminoacyl peptidase
VEQSPLFHADQVTTPILLLHGFDDTNVPKGESDGFYLALKMLGREVEYVQIEGQDHHILDHDKRIVWNDTILGWFERELKQRPNWWNALYPE